MYACPTCQHPFEKGKKFCEQCGCNLTVELLIDPICPKCQKTFPDGTKFCDVDGTKLITQDQLIPHCAICGKTYADDTKFCPDDGGQIVVQVQQPILKTETPLSLHTHLQGHGSIATLEKRFQVFTWTFWGGFAMIAFLVMTSHPVFLLGIPLSIAGMVFSLLLQHQAWTLLQSIRPRTTPGKAIGFQFIPLFNFYWGFIAYKGLAEEMNRYISLKNAPQIPKMPESLGLAYAILQCLSIIPVLNMLVGIVIVIIYFLLMNSLKNSLLAITTKM